MGGGGGVASSNYQANSELLTLSKLSIFWSPDFWLKCLRSEQKLCSKYEQTWTPQTSYNLILGQTHRAAPATKTTQDLLSNRFLWDETKFEFVCKICEISK